MKKQIKAIFENDLAAQNAVDLLKEQIPIISVRTDLTNTIPSCQPAIEFGGAIEPSLQIRKKLTAPFSITPSVPTESKAIVSIKMDEKFCKMAVKLFKNEGAHSIDMEEYQPHP